VARLSNVPISYRRNASGAASSLLLRRLVGALPARHGGDLEHCRRFGRRFPQYPDQVQEWPPSLTPSEVVYFRASIREIQLDAVQNRYLQEGLVDDALSLTNQ